MTVQRAKVGWRERERIWCAHVERRLDEARHVDHRLAVFVVGFGIDARMPQDFAACAAVIVHPPQVVAVRHRRERAVERKHLEAVAGEIEVADDLGSQQRNDVRTYRDAEAGKHLFGHRRPAKDVAPLEHEHTPPRTRQIGRVDEPVVPATDNDDVVAHHAAGSRIYRSKILVLTILDS